MVELRKRKAAAEPAAPPPPKKANSVKSAASSNKGESSANGSASVVKVATGVTIPLEGFGGEIETNDGTKVTLKKLVDESKNGVVIFTYPKASTPGCECAFTRISISSFFSPFHSFTLSKLPPMYLFVLAEWSAFVTLWRAHASFGEIARCACSRAPGHKAAKNKQSVTSLVAKPTDIFTIMSHSHPFPFIRDDACFPSPVSNPSQVPLKLVSLEINSQTSRRPDIPSTACPETHQNPTPPSRQSKTCHMCYFAIPRPSSSPQSA